MSTLIVNHYSVTDDKSTSRYITLINCFLFGLVKIRIKTFCFRKNLDGSIDEQAISNTVMEKAVANFIVTEEHWRKNYYNDQVIYNTKVYFTSRVVWNHPDPESKFFSFLCSTKYSCNFMETSSEISKFFVNFGCV